METAFSILEQYIQILMLTGMSKQTAALIVFISFFILLQVSLNFFEVHVEKEIEKQVDKHVSLPFCEPIDDFKKEIRQLKTFIENSKKLEEDLKSAKSEIESRNKVLRTVPRFELPKEWKTEKKTLEESLAIFYSFIKETKGEHYLQTLKQEDDLEAFVKKLDEVREEYRNIKEFQDFIQEHCGEFKGGHIRAVLNSIAIIKETYRKMSGGLSDMMVPGMANSDDEALPPKHMFFLKERPKKKKAKKGKKGKKQKGKKKKKKKSGYSVLN